MTHEPRRDELLDLALGLLEPEQAHALEAHAAGCEACRVELAALRQTRQLVAGLPPIEAPARGAATVLAAARRAAAAAASRPPRWAAPRWLWGGTLGLASAAALAVLVLRLSPSPTRLGEAEAAPALAPEIGRAHV
jgi:anti-sigma factor RsiW